MAEKNNIVLIGMPGAGKSTIGVLLAKTLGYDFIDTDILIVSQEKRKLQEILTEDGLEHFLKIEEDLGAKLDVEKTVIATGGSMALSDRAMKNLKAIGTVVYLEVPYPDIRRRIRNIKTRGIAFKPGENLYTLYRHRKPIYEKHAEITIPFTNDSEETVEKIVELYEKA